MAAAAGRAARLAGRHQGHGRYRGLAHHLRLRRSSGTTFPSQDARTGRAPAAAGAIVQFEDQHAGVGRRRQYLQPGLRRQRQPVRASPDLRRLLGRLGDRARHRHAARWRTAPTTLGRFVSRRHSAAWSACGPPPASSPPSSAPTGPRRSASKGPMGRDCARCAAAAQRAGERRSRAIRWPACRSGAARRPGAAGLWRTCASPSARPRRLRAASMRTCAALFETRVRRSLAGCFKRAVTASPDFTDADFAYKTRRALAFVGTWHRRMREIARQVGCVWLPATTSRA